MTVGLKEDLERAEHVGKEPESTCSCVALRGNAWDTEEWEAAGTDLLVTSETVASRKQTSWREKVGLLGFICMLNHIVERAESYHTWE